MISAGALLPVAHTRISLDLRDPAGALTEPAPVIRAADLRWLLRPFDHLDWPTVRAMRAGRPQARGLNCPAGDCAPKPMADGDQVPA